MNELLINYGGSVKSLEIKGDLVTVGAYGVLWGSPNQGDLAGDWFTSSTDFGASKGVGVNTMLHHGVPLSPALKSYSPILLPPTVKAEPDEHGLLVASILDRRQAYQRKIYELTEEGALDWSSGAITRAVIRANNAKSGEIVQWPVYEFSYTPTPAEFRLGGIRSMDEVKSVPEDWFGNVSYAKAVRVLSDLAPKADDATTSAAEKKDGPFKSCSTQCNLAASDAKTVRDWGAANIPDDVLADDGREDDPHITVLYGLTDDDVEEVRARVAQFGAFKAKIGEVDVFEAPDYDVVMLRVDSLDLLRLNTTLKTLDHTSTHPTYQPHITLAYVESGAGAQFKGEGPLTGQTLSFDGFVFSDKKGDLSAVSTVAGQKAKDEAKSAPYDFDGQMMVGAALREACDRLAYYVLPEVLNPSTPPMTVGLTTIVPPTKEERLTYLETHLSGFTELVTKMATFILEMRGDETPDDAVKSLRPELLPSHGLPFREHSEKTLAVLEDYQERAHDLIALRASSRKSGRVLSKSNATRLCDYRARLQTLHQEIDELLAEHNIEAPGEQVAGDVAAVEPGIEQKATIAPATIDAEVLEMELRFLEQNFEAAALS